MYSDKEINEFRRKDMRISWLSIFSSLCGMFQGQSITDEKYSELVKTIASKANEVNKGLYEKYPFEEKTVTRIPDAVLESEMNFLKEIQNKDLPF